jgi:hypothetical protein
MNNMSWAEKQARLADEFGTARKTGESAKELLKYSETNRHIESVKQAQWATACHMQYSALVVTSDKPAEAVTLWGWIPEIVRMVEKYQGSLDGKFNNRREFIEALGLLAKAQSQKGKGELSITTSSGGQEE